MKKIRIYLAALLLLPGLSSCGDFLDKESYTDQDREILKTPEGIEALLNGVYDIFQHANYYGRNLMAYEAAKGNDFFVRVSSGNSFERENRYAESTASSGPLRDCGSRFTAASGPPPTSSRLSAECRAWATTTCTGSRVKPVHCAGWPIST